VLGLLYTCRRVIVGADISYHRPAPTPSRAHIWRVQRPSRHLTDRGYPPPARPTTHSKVRLAGHRLRLVGPRAATPGRFSPPAIDQLLRPSRSTSTAVDKLSSEPALSLTRRGVSSRDHTANRVAELEQRVRLKGDPARESSSLGRSNGSSAQAERRSRRHHRRAGRSRALRLV
jgi:hypothetical protein